MVEGIIGDLTLRRSSFFTCTHDLADELGLAGADPPTVSVFRSNSRL